MPRGKSGGGKQKAHWQHSTKDDNVEISRLEERISLEAPAKGVTQQEQSCVVS